MKIKKVWAMPSRNTFTIKPIRELITPLLGGGNYRPIRQ